MCYVLVVQTMFETTDHILFQCFRASEIWKIIFDRVFLETNFNGSFVDRWERVYSSCSSLELRLVAVSCSTILNDRNKIVHEEAISSIEIRSNWINDYLVKYLEANPKVPIDGAVNRCPGSATFDAQWIPPHGDFWKFNVDADLDLISPLDGHWRDWQEIEWKHCWSSHAIHQLKFGGPGAELKAIREGVILDLKLECKKVIVESNSAMAIKFIKKEAEVWSNMEGVVKSIWDLIPHFSEILFQYIPRSMNRATDGIAKRARVSDSYVTQVENFLVWMCSLVENDRFPVAQVTL